LRHAREHVFRSVGLTDSAGELGKDLVGRRALSSA
jgi:hypothetical protein